MINFRSAVANSLKLLFFTSLLPLVVAISGSRAVAQAQAEEVVRTDISLVQLNVGVVDREGRSVTHLSRNDFAVYEDGYSPA